MPNAEPMSGAPHALPEIPYYDLGRGGPLALLDAAAERLVRIVADCRRHYGGLVLRAGDAATRRWLVRNRNPYHHEIAAVAARAVIPGAYLLNLSFEWSCTTGVARDPSGVGTRMLRTLDWPVAGLGRHVVVTRTETDAGAYLNVTWPGFVGVLTAMAPGRFAAAINQPPMRRRSGSLWFDWAIARRGVWRRSSLPPAHLLRHVFDTCRTYEEARALLTETPVCVPAFFVLAGTGGEGCTIERREHDAAVHAAPAAIANHWLSVPVQGHERTTDSIGRLAMMNGCLASAADDFGWLQPPVANRQTRLAVVANPERGALRVQGWEADGPATRIFTLSEHRAAETPRTRRTRRSAKPA